MNNVLEKNIITFELDKEERDSMMFKSILIIISWKDELLFIYYYIIY